jgi:hypothetical protein
MMLKYTQELPMQIPFPLIVVLHLWEIDSVNVQASHARTIQLTLYCADIPRVEFPFVNPLDVYDPSRRHDNIECKKG